MAKTISNATAIANKIRMLEKSEMYQEAEWVIMEETQSCDEEECIAWMIWYMRDALRQGSQYKREKNQIDTMSRCRFLVAFDIFTRFTGRRDDIVLEW